MSFVLVSFFVTADFYGKKKKKEWEMWFFFPKMIRNENNHKNDLKCRRDKENFSL